ncbi:hypothetical protein RM553_17965 [Zunongwangia sp. F363]|uniref:Anti-sigma factor n=1 Tax=Autumnicola tepida TaxID=3075595 RepID=A0ABU3CEF1_9FLAO|nr:hypothetical protein [Zunongwangia sp. F363]MDT0644732.1 hypothetical protein [Zunongwangia sp. F363]
MNMELGEVEKLIAKYEEGETTLAEEQRLKNFFSNNKVPAHLEVYQWMFGYTAAAKTETFNAKVPIAKPKKKNYLWMSIAATVVLAIGIFFYQEGGSDAGLNEMGMTTEQEMAYQQAKQTLLMVSGYMNEGKEDLVYIKEFNKTANKYINLK